MAIKPITPVSQDEVKPASKEEVLAEREILKETLKEQEIKKDKYKNLDR